MLLLQRSFAAACSGRSACIAVSAATAFLFDRIAAVSAEPQHRHWRRRLQSFSTEANNHQGHGRGHGHGHIHGHNEDHDSLLRFDAMTGTWVVYSTSRRNRPRQTDSLPTHLRLSELPRIVDDCPFCAGNEGMTPPALYRIQSNGSGSGGVRVVPNKYPAVALLRPYQKHHHNELPNLINDGVLTNNQVPAVGFHEVVIESPYHNDHIATTTSNSMARDLLTAFRDRGIEHRQYDDVEHTVFFKNHGTTAGASLVHPHSQIVSTRTFVTFLFRFRL